MLESFDQFYNEIHENQQNLQGKSMNQQKEEVFIILLKNQKTDFEIKKVEDSIEIDHQLSLIDVHLQEQEATENVEAAQQFPIPPTSVDVDEEQVSDLSNEDCEPTRMPLSSSKTIENEINLSFINREDFPNELIKDGKLIIKGKELSKLIARFYRLECELCDLRKKFRKFTSLISHFKTEHSIKGYVTCCGQKIIKIRQIAMHMARHLQPGAFQCTICKKLLTCPKILQYHIQNHLPENERNLACPEPSCTRRFSYQSALVTHSISHLPDSERTTFGCETCGRKFSTAGRLSAHISVVHSKNIVRKEFTCEICSKNFLCKSNLSYHLTTHKNFEFQVECKICKKWLKNKICLRKHMTVHSEIRHYCDTCDYSAANKQCLMNHKRVQHSDSKPFTCEVCLKSFKLKNTLTNHANAQHNGLRKYSCEFCLKTFVSSGNCKP